MWVTIDSKSKSFELITGISSSRLRVESFARKYVKDNNVCVDPKSVRDIDRPIASSYISITSSKLH